MYNESNNKKYKRSRVLTTNAGQPISNDEDSTTVSPNGPVLSQDTYLIKKISQFDKERVPPRVVHAKGAGAMGYFELYNSMNKYTTAKIFTQKDVKVPVTVRFSLVGGSIGVADTTRDVRGMATKFFTDEGNLDILCNHMPVFFVRDAKKIPDMVHAFEGDPRNNLPNPNRFWDFISLSPESTNMITFLFSDIGTMKSFRTMNSFGVNTFVWINDSGTRFYIKYHWITPLGVETIDRKEAQRLSGIDPNIAVRDLYDTIDNGDQVEYILKVQIMEPAIAKYLDFDPLDPTVTWPENQFPLKTVGKMTLNKNPNNFFSQVEQLAFDPTNLVEGIEFSQDKLLQGRTFTYRDTQSYRIGSNFEQLPANKPLSSVDNNSQNGAMSYYFNEDPINYKPNSLSLNNPKEAPVPKQKPKFVSGNIVQKPITKQDNFKEAGERYRDMSYKEQEVLIDNLVDSLQHVRKDIQLRATENFCKADEEWGNKVRKRLNV